MPRKLHELIAVLPDLKGAAEKIIQEGIGTLSNKEAHFMGQKRRYEKLIDNEQDLPDEDKPLVTTVRAKLAYVFGVVGKSIDAAVSQEVTNTQARAALLLDEKPFTAELPAVVLINLENQFKKIREMLGHIPTLDPMENWKFDSNSGEYVAEDRVTFKTKKVLKNHVKYDATKEHPAQVETYTEDIPVGKWYTKKFSGMYTPAEKSEILGRVDSVIQALKTARERANDIQVQETKIAVKLFEYILGDNK